MKKNLIVIICILIVIFIGIYFFTSKKATSKKDNYLDNSAVAGLSADNNVAKNTNNEINKNMDNQDNKNYTSVTLHTNVGDISFEFSKDKPKTVENFIRLASEGFYDGVKFHRVIEGFMIQTGDPLSKDDNQKAYWGTGGPGYKFADELTGSEQYTIGTVAMANSGPDTNGSQFFIMTSNTPLPPNYTVFGKVTVGQDVAMKIQEVQTDANDRPLSPIIINSVELK